MVTLFQDKLNEKELVKLGLNPRQVKAVLFVKDIGKITNSEYRDMNGVTDRTALRDLDELVSMNIFKKHGEKKNTHYTIDSPRNDN